MTRARVHAALLCILLAGTATPARGQATEPAAADTTARPPAHSSAAPAAPRPRDESPDDRSVGALDWRYLVDGGVVPFLYGTGAAGLALTLWIGPPDEPRLFDPGEGGAPNDGDSVPTGAVAALMGVGLAAAVATPGAGRWYHVKGMGESLATTWFLTNVAKSVFGRHRPHYDLTVPENNGSDGRKSFFSAHASMTLATTTYLGLYLHGNVFPRWRAPGSALAWWEVFPYAGLAALSVYVPASRVADNRHHLSDVITGALVGSSMSIGFYAWQESRYRDGGRGDARVRAMIVPAAGVPGAAVAGWF